MRELRCIAIDDEPLALTVISNFCRRYGGLKLTTYSEPRIGFEAICKDKPDFVFLDIEMNSLSGLDIARKIPVGCLLIFTTAHAQFALEGFNLDAVDFLHKPFAYERFEKAVDKVCKRLEAEQSLWARTITVKQEYSNVVVPVSDILYMESLENYIKIYCSDGRHIISKTSMKAIMAMLPEDQFLRIHKSYLVSVAAVSSFTRTTLNVKGTDIVLPVGRLYAAEVMRRLKE